MSPTEILEFVGILLGLLGGGGVIIFGFSSFLGKAWAERLMSKSVFKHEKELEEVRDKYVKGLEKLKVQLKKSEFLFEKEFLAASVLVEYHEEILPLTLHPDMHMDDVFEDIALKAGAIEKWIKEFVSKHGAIPPLKVATDLMMAARLSGELKFEVSTLGDLNEKTVEKGQEVYDRIRGARDAMKEKVWQQSST